MGLVVLGLSKIRLLWLNHVFVPRDADCAAHLCAKYPSPADLALSHPSNKLEQFQQNLPHEITWSRIKRQSNATQEYLALLSLILQYAFLFIKCFLRYKTNIL